MTEKKRQKAYRFGKMAEFFTCAYLMLRGYRILFTRYKTKVGEIDIVAKRRDVVAMVEVKARRGAVDEVLTVHQQRRIERAAMLFIAKHPQFATLSIRFDVMLWQWPCKLRYIQSAWLSRAV